MSSGSKTEHEAATATTTTTTTEEEEQPPPSPSVKVKLRRPKAKLTKKVSWTEDTVDNEGFGKKKSKCCCVYERPKQFGESSESESEGECEHCSGHVEARHRRPMSPPPPVHTPPDDVPEEEGDEEDDGDTDNIAGASAPQ